MAVTPGHVWYCAGDITVKDSRPHHGYLPVEEAEARLKEDRQIYISVRQRWNYRGRHNGFTFDHSPHIGGQCSQCTPPQLSAWDQHVLLMRQQKREEKPDAKATRKRERRMLRKARRFIQGRPYLVGHTPEIDDHMDTYAEMREEIASGEEEWAVFCTRGYIFVNLFPERSNDSWLHCIKCRSDGGYGSRMADWESSSTT